MKQAYKTHLSVLSLTLHDEINDFDLIQAFKSIFLIWSNLFKDFVKLSFIFNQVYIMYILSYSNRVSNLFLILSWKDI